MDKKGLYRFILDDSTQHQHRLPEKPEMSKSWRSTRFLVNRIGEGRSGHCHGCFGLKEKTVRSVITVLFVKFLIDGFVYLASKEFSF